MCQVSKSTLAGHCLHCVFCNYTAMVFSEQDIMKATDNFSALNQLGSGGFGVVHKGWINGTTVAVKRLTEVCTSYLSFITSIKGCRSCSGAKGRSTCP